MPNRQKEKTILVTGATGGQGGAVARSLLRAGWQVRALVRDPAAPRARALAALGARPVAGDLDEPGTLRAAARGAYGVFSVQPADLTDPRPEAEVRRGRNVIDAARAVGAAHLVYASVGAAGRGSGVGHFESKAEIEAYLAAGGPPATVLRPVFFMENWLSLLPGPENGARVARIALDAGTPLQMIALADIGRIAAEAFGNPGEFLGRRIEIAGDELTPRQIAAALGRADGVPTRFERQPVEELRAHSGELARMFAWLNETGYRADLPALRARHPGLLSFEDWLRARRPHGPHGPRASAPATAGPGTPRTAARERPGR
ncbi:NmrA/HSCARG family protein [Streptomyces hoynatensis]|uniref:NmrA/HSCARG family protein n=1 Tax=Streptomyces hoynatensis TaxID=1141874 RepID=A0A3A9YU08_9ACTN|nr:NmrA/HSCARG family protein [Streptomyces hoynatensis]RKN39475.1 NmrA/HSCARG family protein [Streptomyces hoynatensis]